MQKKPFGPFYVWSSEEVQYTAADQLSKIQYVWRSECREVMMYVLMYGICRRGRIG